MAACISYDLQLDAELCTSFAEAELRMLEVLNDGPQAMSSFEQYFDCLLSRSRSAIQQRLITPQTCSIIHAIAATIRDISQSLLDEERRGSQLQLESQSRWKRLLSENTMTSTAFNTPSKRSKPSIDRPKKSKKEEAPSTDTTKYRPCRDYFMSNFGSPYPSGPVKQAMAEQIGCTVTSVNQWFTNYRRRSGWMKIMKDYADNDKAKMRAIVNAALGSSPSNLLEPVVTAVRAAREYIDKLATPVLSDAFLQALKMEPLTLEELAELKAQRRNARKERVEAKKLESKRKRVAEDRAAKNGHAAVIGAQVAPVAGKRKRNAEDTAPDGERPMKKRGALPSSRRPRHPNVNVRIVLDTNGVPRKLRRKVPLQSSTPNGQFQALFVSNSKPTTPVPNYSLQISKRDGKRKAVDLNDTESPEPRYPSEHKRRRTNPKVVATPSAVDISTHAPFDPRSASAPSGMLSIADSTFALDPEWNHALRAASLPVNFPVDPAPEQSRALEIFQPDPSSVNDFMQYHESSTFNQSPLPPMNTNPNLMAPSFDVGFFAAFEFGHTSPADNQFPVSNEIQSSSHHPFHDLAPQTLPLQHWPPPKQTSPHRSFSPEAEGRAAARAAKVEELQRRRLAAEEEVQRLKRLEEEAAQIEDDIDVAATFALAQAAQHL